jgi:hypothetical protein
MRGSIQLRTQLEQSAELSCDILYPAKREGDHSKLYEASVSRREIESIQALLDDHSVLVITAQASYPLTETPPPHYIRYFYACKFD